MPLGELFASPTDTREELMAATYAALCEHGYADLTIQRISDHFPKSRSLLYHHYDSKDELLIDFLGFVLDHLESTLSTDDDADATTQLTALLDHILPTNPTAERSQFLAAIIELRAQAATDPEYQAHFTRSTQYFHDQFVGIIERGISNGEFRPVDAARVAALFVTTIEGAMLREATTAADDAVFTTVRTELDAYIEARLMTTERSTSE
jgi:AcrR family transcriptional regulator